MTNALTLYTDTLTPRVTRRVNYGIPIVAHVPRPSAHTSAPERTTAPVYRYRRKTVPRRSPGPAGAPAAAPPPPLGLARGGGRLRSLFILYCTTRHCTHRHALLCASVCPRIPRPQRLKHISLDSSVGVLALMPAHPRTDLHARDAPTARAAAVNTSEGYRETPRARGGALGKSLSRRAWRGRRWGTPSRRGCRSAPACTRA